MDRTRSVTFVILIGLLTVIALTGLFPSGTAFADNSFTYIVARNECLWSIANKFGTTVEALKAANGLESDLLQVGQNLVIPGNRPTYQPVSRGAVSRPDPASVSAENETSGVGQLVSWSSVDGLFPRGSTAVLQDFETGRQFKIYRLFGTNHADCEPLTAEDTRIMKECFGNQWSWNRRAAILFIDDRSIACSMAGMPHGTSQHIFDNNFNGHFDLHFLNSRTHGTNRVDPGHQAAVHQAAGA